MQVEFVDIGGNYDPPLLALFSAGTPPDAFWLRLTNFAGYLSKNGTKSAKDVAAAIKQRFEPLLKTRI